MATSWQETYEKLRKQKEALDSLQGNDIISTLPTKKSSTSTKKTTTKKKKDEEEEKRTWFSSGVFDDGYDFGDITKSILGTTTDIYGDLVRGAARIGEGAIDTGAYLVGGTAKLFGADEFAKNTKDFIKKDLVGDSKMVERITNTSTTGIVNNILTGNFKALNPFGDEVGKLNKVEDSSFLGDKSDSLVQSGGQLAGTFGLQALGVPWWVTTGVTSFGGGTEEAFKDDASYGKAGAYGLISAGAEILTEKLSGGISFGGKTLDAGLKKALTEKIANKTLNTLTKFGIDAIGEGGEEVLTEVITNVGKKLTYEDEKTWDELLSSEEAMDGYLEAFIGGAVLSGGINVGKVNNSIKTSRDYDTGLTDNEQKVVDSEVKKRIEGKQLTNKQKAKIEAEVREDLEKGYISTDTIESTLGGNTFNSLQSIRNNKTNLESEITELENKPFAELTVKEKERLDAIREEFKTIDTNTLENQLQAEMSDRIKSDGYLQRSYQEKANRGQQFTYDSTKITDENEKSVYESATKVMNNTNRSHEFVEKVAKIAKDKGTNYGFINNTELKTLGYDVEGKQVNGLVRNVDGKQQVLINVDSAKALNTIVGHETTHLLEGTQEYNDLQEAIFNYAKEKGDFDSRQSSLAEIYKNVENADIDTEITADLVGDYLFTDENFINTLSTQKPTVFQKIKELINDLVVRFTGTKEEKTLREVQKKFKEAYRKNTQSTNGTKLSLISDNANKTYIQAANKNKAIRMQEKGASEQEIWLATGYQYNNGQWQTEVKDPTLKTNQILELGKEYKLEDVVDATELFKAYPELKNRTVSKVDFVAMAETAEEKAIAKNLKGGVTNDGNIYISNTIASRVKANEVLTHEVQHLIQELEGIESNDTAYLMQDESGGYYISKEYLADLEEIEARQVQNRASMSEEQRKNTLPKNTTSKVAKYSLSDNQGRKLSDNQIEYFKESKARDEDGSLTTVYHTSPNAGFTVFEGSKGQGNYKFGEYGDSITYFTNSKEMSESYSKNSKDAGTYEGYVNLTNPYVVDAKGRNWNRVTDGYSQETYDKYDSLNEIERDYLMDLASWDDARLFKTTIEDAHRDINIEYKTDMGEDVEALASAYKKLEDVDLYDLYDVAANDFSYESIRENSNITLSTNDVVKKALKDGSYDGVIIKNVVDYGSGTSQVPANVYVAFNSNQFKNVDNTNPTSDADIRYSLSDKGTLQDSNGNDVTLETSETGTHGTLMAIHNLSDSKLKGILELGGFPLPSIAIMNPATTDLDYGDISVLFDKSTIDPSNKANEVYGSDVYSPRFPQTVQKINEKELSKLEKYLDKRLDIEDTTLYETVQKNRYTNAFIKAFAKENNIEVDIVYKDSPYNYEFSTDEATRQFIKDNDITYEKLLNDKKLREEFYGLYREASLVKDWAERKIETFEKVFEQGTLNNNLAPRLDNDFNAIKNGAEKVIDDYATEKALRDKVLNEYESQYTNFLNEKLSPVFGDKYIRNKKDLFTPAGNRRSFNQLYNEYTLSNVVKEMKGKVRGEEGFFYGAGNIRSQVTPQFKSIAEIKANESKLVTNSVMETVKQDIDSDLNNLSATAKNFGGYSYDSYETALNEIAGLKKITSNKVKSILNEYGFNNVPDILVDKSIEFLEKLKNAPTEYFEAKPQRAVGLDEVQAIVIPNYIDNELKQQLLDNGLNIVEYDPNIEGDKQNKINQFDDLKFSLSQQNEQIAPTGDYNVYGEDVKLQQTIAPLQEEIKTLTETVQELKEQLAPVKESDEYNALTETDLPMLEQQYQEAFNNIDESSMPSEIEEIAPTNEITPTKSLFETRDYEDVGDRKTNAYQYDNPEVKPFFQEAAQNMLYDLRSSIKGERMYNDDLYYDSGGEQGYFGTKRQTTVDIAELLDGMDGKYKYSYADIEKGLNAIIKDEGAENNAISKRIEFYLDRRLREGYTDVNGVETPANQNYLSTLQAKDITDYYNNLPIGEAPVENVDNSVNNVSNSKVAPIKMEAIKPAPTQDRDTHGYRLVRVKTDAELQTETNQEIAKILTEEPTTENKRNKRKWAILKANVLDKGMVFEDISLKHKNRDLMGKWDYTLTAEARGQNVIGNGHYEYDPYSKTSKQVSKSLNDIRAEVDNTGLTAEFYEYIYHKHNVDRMRLEGRYEGMENKPVFGYNVTSEQSQQVVRKYETQHPEFITFAQDVYDYLDADRQVLVDNGVISQETADLWKSMYPHYVPIRRAGHTGLNINVPLDTGRTGVNAPIKKATGGNQDILPLFDTMASRTLQTYRATAKNSFGVELKNTIGTTINSQTTNIDEVIDSIDAQEGLLQEGKNGEKPTFTVFENGEKVTFEITEDMYDALKPLDNSSLLSKTFLPFNKASNFHRGLLTEYNPVFMLTNGIKDAQDILINSQHAAKTYAKVPEAFAQLVTKGYWYQEYMANGGEQNSYFDSVENTFKAERKGLGKILDLPPLSTISQLNNFIERTPRLAEYIASREAGRSIEVAMLDAARVTTNFKAGGNLTKWANRNGATFLNASVQGAMQQVRNVREANANGIRGWANLATKFAVAGLPAMLLNALLWEDDEDYEELSDYVKQNYYIVAKNDDGTFIRIPKGRTLAVIQEGMQQMKNLTTGDDEADLKTFIDLFLTNLAPNNPVENNILSPIIQVANNKTWYGEDLVPTRLQDLPATEQYDESTDSFSRWLGEKTNISPVKINYLLDQYSGGVGDVVLPMLTPEAKSDADTFEEQLLAPLKSKFTVSGVMNNQNVADFYDKSEELTTEAKKSDASDEDILSNKYINSVKAEMNELYKHKREIQNSNLSNSEKYRQVLEVQTKINELTKEALSQYENVDVYSNYATAGDRQYRLTDDGEWQKINDKQLEKQDEVTSSLGITPNDYWSNKEEYDYAYENPSKYALANAIADYSTFRELSSELYDIKADKDEDGKSISGSRKEKVFDYINNLDLDFEQRVMLAKLEYPSYDEYNYEIVEYLNNRDDISYEQMVSILNELEMKVDANGNVTWD